MQQVRLYLSHDAEPVRGWLDEMLRIQRSIRLGSRIQEWQESYSRLRDSLPAKYRLVHAKFNALSNRALYSREPLDRFWHKTIWNIDPGKLTISLIKDFFLTTSFVSNFRSGSRAE